MFLYEYFALTQKEALKFGLFHCVLRIACGRFNLFFFNMGSGVSQLEEDEDIVEELDRPKKKQEPKNVGI